MSQIRQLNEPAVRSYAVTHPGGTVILPQGHGWDQLLYASTGVMRVETADGAWIVPPHRAVWVPALVDHRIVMTGRVSVRSLYFSEGLAALPRTCRVVNVPPLLRELILHAVRSCPLQSAIPEHQRLIGVLLDQLVSLPVAPLQLPVPRDSRAARVAAALMDDPSSPDSIGMLAARAGASARTIERLFSAETGMTFELWRRRLRLVESLRLLAAGQPVTEVALAVGYSTPSAYTAMFRREMGTSPARYFRD